MKHRVTEQDAAAVASDIASKGRGKNLNAVDTIGNARVNDHKAAKSWLRALEMTAPIASEPACILPTAIEDIAGNYGEAPALLSERERFTYRMLVERSNQYARWALAQGIAKGDVVCLLMPNRPEYMAIWLGITRVGGIVSLLNTKLAGSSLAHCINIVEPKHVIVQTEFVAAVVAVLSALHCRPQIWLHGGITGDFAPIDEFIKHCPGEKLANDERRIVTIEDRALLIYTSGTTGLPKAAIISHYRLMLWSRWFAGMMNTQVADRMYDCLPMYHSIGGVVATGALLVSGGSVVIREKFSAAQFWNDIVDWDCTLFQYIGELCRYLVNTPHQPRETEHRLRLCCGNGLRQDVWEVFKTRFRIPQILEFYAATEGNLSLYNVESKPGAIGRVPPYLARRFPVAIVKSDLESGMTVRDAKGFCTRCAAGEPGEALGRIVDDGTSPGSRFEGYTSAKDSEKKILRNVFRNGDAWFRTGDLMKRDSSGYFYFVDRIGDTFRWKGENVSTSEVSEAICACPGVMDATVYGVIIPRTEGRAGMAALVVDREFDLVRFREHLLDRLPDYARPLFVLIRNALEMTSTFKHKNSYLVAAGYDPKLTADPIYFNDPEPQAFVALDDALYARIRAGQIRV
jgi:fatty-acyl-CoA synthase